MYFLLVPWAILKPVVLEFHCRETDLEDKAQSQASTLQLPAITWAGWPLPC